MVIYFFQDSRPGFGPSAAVGRGGPLLGSGPSLGPGGLPVMGPGGMMGGVGPGPSGNLGPGPDFGMISFSSEFVAF